MLREGMVQKIYPLVMTNRKLLKMAIEIVDFPIENGDFPVRYVKLPEDILQDILYMWVFSIIKEGYT
jgi:hypothetical protein